ncbi:MAG: HlyD family efflux transporter periplasmic adaptor subunit [Pseudomonadota bacterium]
MAGAKLAQIKPERVQAGPDGVRPGPRLISNRDGANAAQADQHAKTLKRVERLEALLKFESQVRGVTSARELWFCLANEALHLTSARQIFVLRPNGRVGQKLKLCAVSNLSMVDANSPAVIALEKHIADALKLAQARGEEQRSQPYLFALSQKQIAEGRTAQRTAQTSALDANAVLLTMRDGRDQVLGAMVICGDTPDIAAELPVLNRVGQVAQFAWRALAPRRAVASSLDWRKILPVALVLMVMAGLFVRVPLSTLAPVEIVASDPEVIAAPISGVIRKILVDGNKEVTAGTPLFQYEDAVLLAELKIAEQTYSVANAKLKKAQQSSFGQGGGRQDLATAEAELGLARAELNFARSKFSQTVIKAPKDGVVVLDRKSDWQGKPVSVGERVLDIAQVDRVEARIDLPVSDAIVLRNGAPVKLYLDTNPLKALEAEVSSASYRASLDVSNALSFTVRAKLAEGDAPLPRIGARGTAQVSGDDVSLGFYLFRRPLAAIRQWIGF